MKQGTTQKYSESVVDGYSTICIESIGSVGDIKGCFKRWGDKSTGPRSLDHKLCPACEYKWSENRLKLIKQRF